MWITPGYRVYVNEEKRENFDGKLNSKGEGIECSWSEKERMNE